MIHIRTPSRLHFGLLSLPAAHGNAWLNHDGEPTLPRRQFGGVGLMIDRPGIELTVQVAKTWSAYGPSAERALYFAQTYCSAAGVKEPFQLRIESAPPQHAGLGTGTQLGLAIARGIAELTGQAARDAVTLARHIGRGLRSALGVHGFEQGGLLVEGGKTVRESISPLVARLEFPDDWQVMLITPRDLVGTHGRDETEAFTDLAQREDGERTTETLCRLVLTGMLPALMERNLEVFGEAVGDFNRRVGEMFRSAQGGTYGHPRVEGIIKTARLTGIRGVGQSSWGPTVFAIAAPAQLIDLHSWLKRTGIADQEMVLTKACNRGAETVLSTEY